MSAYGGIHEDRMNSSLGPHPRGGVGVRGRCGVGVISPIHDIYRYARGPVMDAAFGGEHQ